MADKFFGLFLLERGALTSAQLMEAVAAKPADTQDIPFELRAVDAQLLTHEQAQSVEQQRKGANARFEDTAQSMGLLTKEQVDQLESAPPKARLLLGVSLLKSGVLTLDALSEHLDSFHQEASEVSAILSELYYGLPNAHILEAVTSVTIRLFQRMLHAFVKPSSLRTNPRRIAPSAYTVKQDFKGDFEGSIHLNFSTSMLRAIASRLLGVEVEQIDEDALDCASEFINVISGNVCGQLSNEGIHVELGPPEAHACGIDQVELGEGFLTVTALAHPDEHIEVCILDRTARE